MVGIFLLFFWIGLGMLLARQKWVSISSAQLNLSIINIVLPATTLLYISRLSISLQLIYPISVAWIIFILAWVLFALLGHWLKWDRATIGCMILCCGLGNTAFLGYPIIKTLFGKAGLGIAIIVDQPGTFLVLSTLGILVAALYAAGRITILAVLRRIFTFPPFLAFILALFLLFTGLALPSFVTHVLRAFSYTLVPLALVAVGMQLKPHLGDINKPPLAIGLGYKLVLAPIVIYLFMVFLKTEALSLQVSTLQAAMAPMITGAILAANYELRPPLAYAFLNVGIPLSFITLVVWYAFLML
ncbi:MAG: AEC family transporter [Chitinophagales bacterium]|nr:AEC family transporter [Chitinophagales bacterium]